MTCESGRPSVEESKIKNLKSKISLIAERFVEGQNHGRA